MKPSAARLQEVASFANLRCAWLKARTGKRRRPEVAQFALDLENELLRLQRDLLGGEYRPGGYREFTIYERKPRAIVAAPFRDRVVHHALIQCVEADWERQFHPHSYACRPGKGVHKAVDYYQRCARRYAYALKMDVSRYFASVDKRHLKNKLRRRLADPAVFDLFARIIDHYRPGDETGLPIGNLTSQILANVYLDDFDRWIARELGCRAYLRYVDDFVLLADDKSILHVWRRKINQRLREDKLTAHPGKQQVMPTHLGVDILGYRIWPYRRQLRNDNGYRFQRRLKGMARAFAQGRADLDDFNPAIQSWIGHSLHGETAGLRRAIFGRVIFSRET